jgi:hypothetical protein
MLFETPTASVQSVKAFFLFLVTANFTPFFHPSIHPSIHFQLGWATAPTQSLELL